MPIQKPIDTTKLETGLALVLAFLIINNKTDKDTLVLTRIEAALQKLLAQGTVTPKQFIDGMFNVVDWSTDVIPGTLDDSLVDNGFQLSRTAWERKLTAWLESKEKTV